MPPPSRALIVDAHAHIGRPDPGETGPGYDPTRWRGQTEADLLGLMDAAEVDVAVLHTNDLWANPYHRRVVGAHPVRLFGVLKIDDSAALHTQALDALRAQLDDGAFRGVYFDPWPPGNPAFSDFHSRRFDLLWRALSELATPLCFVNYGQRSPQRVRHLRLRLDRFPALTVTVVHGLYPGGGRPPDLLNARNRVRLPAETVELVRTHDVHLEVLSGYVDGDFGPNDEVIKALYDTFGATKFVWGAEFTKVASLPREPSRSVERYRHQFTYLAERCPYLTADDLALIRGGNAGRIYELTSAPEPYNGDG